MIPFQGAQEERENFYPAILFYYGRRIRNNL